MFGAKDSDTLFLAVYTEYFIVLQTLIDVKLGLFVQHGDGNLINMKVRESYKGEICGLCGDYNGDPANDWTTGPRCGQEETSGLQVSLISVNRLSGQPTKSATS